MEAVLAGDLEEARQILTRGDIPVMVDERADVRETFCPDVLIDAIIAKKNTGTKITDAPFCHRGRTGIYSGEGLPLCHRDKEGTHPGQTDLGGTAIPTQVCPAMWAATP